MFDIGFWELAVIGVVALLVVGPERLPGLARTTGHWVGRARRFVSGVKADIDREIAADELKKALAKQANSEALYEIIEETKQTILETKDQLEAQGEDDVPPEPEIPAAVTHKSNDTNG
ncbi:sec-independent protein translocase protein TatB [Thiogranum longum]|uniref:Sec-independent protein translocase protein TatB n=1 Tax=Thiogranum longum TaxID=1537524 RepID=A0A4R1HC26_9GAMM|nr:Sec-independent protein translocase protein TatB [Thiogranum longum]TCK19557.1 sec-independent protein translocase protein TatB [Thiogranum longum]